MFVKFLIFLLATTNAFFVAEKNAKWKTISKGKDTLYIENQKMITINYHKNNKITYIDSFDIHNFTFNIEPVFWSSLKKKHKQIDISNVKCNTFWIPFCDNSLF